MAVRITRNGRPLPDQHPLDEYGYGQTFDVDRDQAASWIRTTASTKSIAECDWKWEKEHLLIFEFKRDQAYEDGGDRMKAQSEFDEQSARIQREGRQRLRQNKLHFEQRVAEERTRHPIANCPFTPANDSDYQADVRQIQRDFEQRMTEMVERAEEIRDTAMKKAYERHDIRKGEWNADADYIKRQLALRRHEQSTGRKPCEWRDSQPGWRELQERLIKEEERAYAKSRPMPTDAEQHTVQSLGPAFFAWEKRASNSHAPGVQRVGGRLGAELEAAPSW
ncbi:MAG: hypothetical protein M1826_006157 [Phylliscum demangeonii]|nr:MAG: hypothetical protein M1826_006157 [Phylliscum demangeonii]